MEITTKDIFLILLGVVITIVTGYFINLTTPSLGNRIQQWRDLQAQRRAKKSVEAAKRRKTKLEAELQRVQYFHSNPTELNAMAFYDILSFIRKLAVLISLVAFAEGFFRPWFFRTLPDTTTYGLIEATVTVIFYVYVFISLTDLFSKSLIQMETLGKIREFENYENFVIEQIEELQEFINSRSPGQVTVDPTGN